MDELLLPLMRVTEEAESQRLLAQLIAQRADPIIKEIIRSRLRLSFARAGGDDQSQGAEDIYGQVIVQLLERLRRLTTQPAPQAISDFRGYVAVTTYHACYQYLRRKYPQRWRLKNRLRYALNHQPTLALWESPDQEWLCGFAIWRHQQSARPHARQLEQLADHPPAFERVGLSSAEVQQLPLADLLTAIFRWVGSPVRLDELVSLIADWRGIQDQATLTESQAEAINELPQHWPDLRVDVASEVDRRLYLQQLWTEIRQLPPRQRRALLLNLRDAQGRGCLALLPLTGVAAFEEVAEALAMSAAELAGLWNDLPLDDATIAQHLGLTAQQVINLRKSARRRLARRMKGF